LSTHPSDSEPREKGCDAILEIATYQAIIATAGSLVESKLGFRSDAPSRASGRLSRLIRYFEKNQHQAFVIPARRPTDGQISIAILRSGEQLRGQIMAASEPLSQPPAAALRG
jgi:hypothetical protein